MGRAIRLLIDADSIYSVCCFPTLSHSYVYALTRCCCRNNRSIRTKSGTKNAEETFPSFLDLVIWGHEHECKPAPSHIDRAIDTSSSSSASTAAPHNTAVLQPGSSVATSLCEGEAEKKHVFILQVSTAATSTSTLLTAFPVVSQLQLEFS